MKICHLGYDDLDNPWLGGGGAIRAREIYRRLAPRHEITLVTGGYPGAAREEWVDGLRIVRLGGCADAETAQGYARSRLSYCRWAPAYLQRADWDVWVHEFSAYVPLWIPRARRRRGILLFQHFMGHHALAKHKLVGAVAWAAEKWTLRAYPRIITVSPSVEQLVRAQLGKRPVQVDCVYNGVEADYFDLRSEEDDYVLYFGRTDVHTKGMDVLIEAFARLAADYPSLQLKIAGRSGNARQNQLLAELIDRHDLRRRVEVVGTVADKDKRELLRRALFLCLPSRYEGWCIVAIEAGAAGKAVVGTRISGLQDAIRHGETGLLVESGRPEQVAEAMRQLLDAADQRRCLGEQGRAWARRFDWDRIAEDHEEICLRAVRQNGLAHK
ncbi:MAG: glycosyltransferase [Candidatus Latescibacteria bacterium]|nr:glycosyltransferase [Candidatus Latescibacterota bacterium]